MRVERKEGNAEKASGMIRALYLGIYLWQKQKKEANMSTYGTSFFAVTFFFPSFTRMRIIGCR